MRGRPAWWPSPREETLVRLALGLEVAPRIAHEALVAASAAPSDEERRLFPLLHRRLAAGPPPAVPAQVALVLRHAWVEARSLRLLAHRQAAAVLASLHAEGVVAAPLKGLALDAWFGGTGRPVGDLDLLVPEAGLDRAVRRLECEGYALRDEARPDAPRAKHACALGREDGAEVDLHWLLDVRLVRQPGRRGREGAMARVWRGTRPATWQGRDVARLRPEHHLLHAVLHGARVDSRSRARWLADAVTIVRAEGPRFDWDEVVDAAIEAGLGRWIAAALGALDHLAPGSVPAEPRRRMERSADGPAERVLWLLDRRQAPAGLARDVQRTLRWHLARRRHLGLRRGLLGYPASLRAEGLLTSPRDLLTHVRRRWREGRRRRLGYNRRFHREG